MKKIACSLLFLFLALFLHAQVIPQGQNFTDSKNRRQGKWVICYDFYWNVIEDSSGLFYYRIIEYKNDKPVGKVHDYYKNGQVQMEATIIKDRPEEVMDGVVIFYRTNGDTQKVNTYKKGDLQGIVEYNLDGTIANPSWQLITEKAIDAQNQGLYAEAQVIFEQALLQAEKEELKDGEMFAKSYLNLANNYFDFGKYKEAEGYYIISNDLFTKLYGSTCGWCLDISKKLAKVYIQQSLYDKAEPILLFLKDLNLRERGRESYSYLTTCADLAYLYYMTGEYDKAERYILEAKSISSELYGKNEGIYINNCYTQAIIYMAELKYVEAEASMLEVYNHDKKLYGSNPLEYANTCNSLANIYRLKGEYSKAEALYLEGQNIREKKLSKDDPAYANSCNSLANLYKDQGLYDKAEALYKEAKNIYEKNYGNESLQYGDACIKLGQLYETLQQNSKAEALYLESVHIYETALGKDNIDYGLTCKILADFYYGQTLYNKAELLYLQKTYIDSIALGKESAYYAEDCIDLASLYQLQLRFEEAEKCYLEAKRITEKLYGKTNRNYSNVCSSLADLYLTMNLFRKAETLYIEAKDIDFKIYGRENTYYAASCRNLANLYDAMELFDKAIELYLQAREINANTLGKEHPEYASDCINLGDAYRQKGLYKEAEELCIEAKNIREKLYGNEHNEYGTACNQLGLVYLEEGLPSKSEPLFLKALEITVKIYGKNCSDYAANCLNLSSVCSSQKKYEQALWYMTEAKNTYEIVDGKDNADYINSCSGLANIYCSIRQFEKAKPLFVEVKDWRGKNIGKESPTYARSCRNLGNLYKKQGRYVQAEELLIEAKNIYEKNYSKSLPDYTLTCFYLADLYKVQNQYIKAEPLYNEILVNLNSDIKTLLPSMSEVERKEFISIIHFYFEEYYSFAYQYYTQNPNITAKLFNLQLVIKGLLLQSSQKMQNQILNSGDAVLIQRYHEWKEKNAYLAVVIQMSAKEKAANNIDEAKLKEEINQLERELSQQSEVFAKATNKKQYQWQDVQKLLKKNEALVEIVRVTDNNSKTTDTLYLALIVTPNTTVAPLMVVIKNGNYLETKGIRYYKNHIALKVEDKESYNRYWGEIATKLKGYTKIYLSADGVYHQLNLSTLKNTNSGKYLGEEAEIQLLSSSKDFILYSTQHEKLQENNEANKLYLFGYPSYYNVPALPSDSIHLNQERAITATIKPLPGSKAEVEAIAKQNPQLSTVYLEEAASEDRLKSLKNPGILHIATHGFFKKDIEEIVNDEERDRYIENPLLRSGLLLSGSGLSMSGIVLEGEDGILTAQEVMNINLDHTSLVVMSACETGIGEVSNGEGIYGLQRAFRQAGAQTLIMSLWKVDDQATQKLMILFYENLLQKKMEKRTAFNAAINSLKVEYPAPYYWGAFIMIGQ